MNKIDFKLLSIVLLTAMLIACSKHKTAAEPVDQGTVDTLKTVGPPVTLSPFEIAAYLPYWGIATYQKYDYSKLTTLYIIATISKPAVVNKKGLIFGDDDSSPNAFDQPDLKKILAFIREKSPGIKIILSISDMHTTALNRAESSTLFTPTGTPETVKYLMVNYVDKFDFDGVDVDIEDESLTMLGANYSYFLKELAIALHHEQGRGKRKLCVATLNPYDFTKVTAAAYESVDLIGVMDYGQEKLDLLAPGTPRDLMREGYDWSQKIAKDKLSFGLGFWSSHIAPDGQHAGDGWDYARILTTAAADTAFVPYLTSYFKNEVKPGYDLRYNGLYETRRKAEFIKKEGFRGVFAWDITKDVTDEKYRRYSLLSMLRDWNDNPENYAPIKATTIADYYRIFDPIEGKYYEMEPSDKNWLGIYELKSGIFTGYKLKLSATKSGTFLIPSSAVATLTEGKLYIIRLFNGVEGKEAVLVGTSHPFYIK